MATLLKIHSSLFGAQGQSSMLADQFSQQWLQQNPHATLLVRDLAAEPVPHLDLARFQAFTTLADARTAEQRQFVQESDRLIGELQQADAVVLAVPMYNFGVPSVLRAYFDQLARSGVTFRYTAEGPQGLLTGKKAYVFITRGGVYGDDHSHTSYLRQFLGFIGISDVQIIYAEGLAISNDNKVKALSDAAHKITGLLSA